MNFWDTRRDVSVTPDKDKQGDTERFMVAGLLRQAKEMRSYWRVKSLAMIFARWQYQVYKTIRAALDSKPQRLQTDHIDIYQLHWPERQTNFLVNAAIQKVWQQDTKRIDAIFGNHRSTQWWNHSKVASALWVIQWYPLGVMRYLAEADKHGLARPITIQNPYSLLNRFVWSGTGRNQSPRAKLSYLLIHR